ncbi:MAG: hypothetical protein ACLQDV_19390 [Candidatus Binataceae bacterium]
MSSRPIAEKTERAARPMPPAPMLASVRRNLLALPLAPSVLITAIFLIQLWGLSQYFPVDSWLTRNPFYTNSYALHFARSLLSASALGRHLRLWSYSPSLMAGYPAGTRTEPMGDAVALWFWICSGFSTVRSFGRAAVLYKAFVVGVLVSIPLAMAAAARWLEFDWTIAVLSAALGVFGTFNYPGLLMIRAGMFAFFSAAFLSVAWGALLYRSMERGAGGFVALAITGGALTYLHPLAAAMLVPPSIAGLAESRSPRRVVALAAALAAAFVLSMGWLGPVLFTRDIGSHFSNWWQTSRSIGGGLGILFHKRLPFPPIAIVAAALYGALQARTRRRFLIVWLVGTFGFGLIAYFGSAIKLFDNVEPARFEIVFYAFAAPFVALGVREFWLRLGIFGSPWRQVTQLIAVVVVAFFALVSGASLWLETTVHGPIVATLPAQASELWGWMTVSGRDSRIVLESGWSRDENGGVVSPYFRADVGLLWALESGREVIGASPSEGFSSFGFVDFGNAIAFGRPLNSWEPADFRRQLDTYNVGALVLWSADAKQYLAGVPGVVALQESDPYTLYGVAGDHSFLSTGKAASVSASQDCIQIKDAEPGRLVLKYHYFKTLRVSPAMAIEPVAVGNGDPNPFIQIDNDAKRDIIVYNAGFSGWGRAPAACE